MFFFFFCTAIQVDSFSVFFSRMYLLLHLCICMVIYLFLYACFIQASTCPVLAISSWWILKTTSQWFVLQNDSDEVYCKFGAGTKNNHVQQMVQIVRLYYRFIVSGVVQKMVNLFKKKWVPTMFFKMAHASWWNANRVIPIQHRDQGHTQQHLMIHNSAEKRMMCLDVSCHGCGAEVHCPQFSFFFCIDC